MFIRDCHHPTGIKLYLLLWPSHHYGSSIIGTSTWARPILSTMVTMDEVGSGMLLYAISGNII
jgi:hypothetical protein